MKEQFRKFLNEEQDPKAIEKISAKLSDLLMKNEEVGYIGVQKKPALTVFPESVVLTNKRIIICRPKNLGLSMEFIDFNWEDVVATFIKENILGSDFSFSTKNDIQVTIDYIPKIQARKLHTFAKEQLEIIKTGSVVAQTIAPETTAPAQWISEKIEEKIEEIETEEVTNYAEIIPNNLRVEEPEPVANTAVEAPNQPLSQDELFAKLQNYKKLLDNGLILQGEYDALKKDILSKM